MVDLANEVIEEARENVANLINAQTSEIIFTSGATESNNLALKSIAKNYFENKLSNYFMQNRT